MRWDERKTKMGSMCVGYDCALDRSWLIIARVSGGSGRMLIRADRRRRLEAIAAHQSYTRGRVKENEEGRLHSAD